MKVQISQRIEKLYKDCKKNYEYSLENIINGFDPQCCEQAIDAVCGLKTKGQKVEIEISDVMVDSIKELMNRDDVTNDIIELLLWTAVIFPEI